MIERVFEDVDGNTLLSLHRMTREQALWVRSEGLPTLAPIGTYEDVPGTGQRVLIGERRPRAGQLVISLGTSGRDHAGAWGLQRELVALAPLIRRYRREPGGTMDVAGYSAVKRTFSGQAQSGGNVEFTLECASPYFWTDQEATVAVGSAQALSIGGVAPTGLRLTLTAGGAAVTDPRILSDAGLTTWHGTVPAGGVLALDGLSGQPATLNGVDVSLYLTGPLPHLEPGDRTVTVTAPGASAKLNWREGEL